jgi:hypothetical protein
LKSADEMDEPLVVLDESVKFDNVTELAYEEMEEAEMYSLVS